MHFDDRLATVLRHRATGEAVARTQFRQLVDLLGETELDGDAGLIDAAYLRLGALETIVPLGQRVRIAGDCSGRIRSVRLVAWFAGKDAALAAAALSQAQLPDEDWVLLIPELSIRARGLLRHRRDLPPGAVAILDQLGARDRTLPEPDPLPLPPLELNELGEPASTPQALDSEPPQAVNDPRKAIEPATEARRETSDIGAIVQRIEAFQKAREANPRPPAPPEGNVAHSEAPRLPLGEIHAGEDNHRAPIAAFIFSTDTDGRIDWAEPAVAPQVVGIELVAQSALGNAGAVDSLTAAFHDRRPVRSATVELAGSERVSGHWLIDAAPRFATRTGRFEGYVGRLRRQPSHAAESQAPRAADRLRQLLHELRTPVNAIQGFAEIIQQQVFGPAPHEYRALAAAIAGDAARILAGFEELERLARLESGAVEPSVGRCDFLAIVRQQIEQLQGVLSTRVARFDADLGDEPMLAAITAENAEMLVWRVLGTLAAATGAGEAITIKRDTDSRQLALAVSLPAALAASDDIFSSKAHPVPGAVGVGLFGAGFAFRLARAEARAAGGSLQREGDRLMLRLPQEANVAADETLDAPNGTVG